MDDDRNWLRNPILPRPPALPRFSVDEMRMVENERPSSVVRVAPRKDRITRVESGRPTRVSGTSAVQPSEEELERAVEAERRIA